MVERNAGGTREIRSTCVTQHSQSVYAVEKEKRKSYFGIYARFIYNSCLIIHFSLALSL